MVQYIVTPWRDRQELLLVREQFYNVASNSQQREQEQSANTSRNRVPPRVSSGDDGDTQPGGLVAAEQPSFSNMHPHSQPCQDKTGKTHRQRQAVVRVSMWMQRGNCPHVVESTALLTAAMLSDEGGLLAGSTFVTGLLDGHQDRQRKQSMYSIAKTIGLPATFVELRHQATHEQLPSLAKLRSAAKKALDWIWNYYWKHLVDESAAPKSDPCREVVLEYLRGGDESHTMRALEQFGKERVLGVIVDVQANLPGNQVYLRCLKLSREVMMREDKEAVEEEQVVDEGVGYEAAASSPGWALYEGPWKPKPIGMFISRRKMHIQSIPMWVGSSNNYAYLVVDDKSKDAFVIDPANPPEVVPILKEAISRGAIHLKGIVNTHHHWDHAGGNKKLLQELGTPGLPIIGGKNCEGVTKTPGHEESLELGDIAIKSVHTPCHTQDSICFFMEDHSGRAVFTGDTLFISGCGKFFEGTAAEMHEALNKRLALLPNDTVVYPGHEYTKSNVKFAISVLPSDPVKKLQAFADGNKVTTGKFTIADEKEHNVFMRVTDPVVQKATGASDPVDVMSKLREMKNNFK
ncbi:hypothetical protein EsHS_00005534 [Epichloe bromicola]